ncbi:MAG: type II secretion system protein J [Phycisphaerales bacterium JB064]
MSPARSAFTLIELSMAMVIGVVVLLAAMGMFQTIERADAIADVRAAEMHQLQRTQAVVSRAMGSLLVMSRQEQQTADAARRASDQAQEAVAAGSDLGAKQEGGTQDTLDAAAALAASFRPRVRLEDDPALQGIRMTRQVRIGDTALGPPEDTIPQRLELALSAPCVIPSYADIERRYLIAELGLVPVEVGSSVDEEGAVRGAFVFRDERRVNNLGQRIFSFWWLPVSGDEDDALAIEAERIDPAMIDGAVQLMDEVVWGRWRFFKKGEWRNTFEVLGELDLAAYGELELTTAQNHTVAWLFELAWTIGIDPDAPAEGEEETETDEGGTTDLGGGPTGQGVMN